MAKRGGLFASGGGDFLLCFPAVHSHVPPFLVDVRAPVVRVKDIRSYVRPFRSLRSLRSPVGPRPSVHSFIHPFVVVRRDRRRRCFANRNDFPLNRKESRDLRTT